MSYIRRGVISEREGGYSIRFPCAPLTLSELSSIRRSRVEVTLHDDFTSGRLPLASLLAGVELPLPSQPRPCRGSAPITSGDERAEGLDVAQLEYPDPPWRLLGELKRSLGDTRASAWGAPLIVGAVVSLADDGGAGVEGVEALHGALGAVDSPEDEMALTLTSGARVESVTVRLLPPPSDARRQLIRASFEGRFTVEGLSAGDADIILMGVAPFEGLKVTVEMRGEGGERVLEWALRDPLPLSLCSQIGALPDWVSESSASLGEDLSLTVKVEGLRVGSASLSRESFDDDGRRVSWWADDPLGESIDLLPAGAGGLTAHPALESARSGEVSAPSRGVPLGLFELPEQVERGGAVRSLCEALIRWRAATADSGAAALLRERVTRGLTSELVTSTCGERWAGELRARSRVWLKRSAETLERSGADHQLSPL